MIPSTQTSLKQLHIVQIKPNDSIKKKKKKLLRKVMGYRIVPLKKLADLGVFRANNLALNLESEPVGSLESQEIRSPQRDLPKHHFFSLSLWNTLFEYSEVVFVFVFAFMLCYVVSYFELVYYSFLFLRSFFVSPK